MGGKCPHRSVSKRRYSHKKARRTKFEIKGDDMVYDALKKPEVERPSLPVDEDLPGMGQFYCLHCEYGWASIIFVFMIGAFSRYFANVSVRDEHFKTKRHRRKVKLMMGPAPHTQLDADLAGGMGMPDNGPKLMAM